MTKRLATQLLLVLGAVACGEDAVRQVGPEIRVTATHVADDGALLLDFGPVPVLNEKRLELIVDNLGQADLHLTSVTIAPADGPFRFDAAAELMNVASAGSVALPVVFRPPSQQDYAAQLTLAHDDEQREPFEIRLVGTGSTVGRIEVEPVALSFGRVGELTQKVLALTIRSAGTAPLIIEEIEIQAGSAPEFSFAASATTPATLPAPANGLPGGEVQVPIRCSPVRGSMPDDLAGAVRIVSTDPEQREIVVPLTATVNRAPVATITEVGVGVAAPGDVIQLDGSRSTDPDRDLPLTFAWRVFRRPAGSQAAFEDPTIVAPTLRLDEPGEYELGLDVADATDLACVHPENDPRIPCARWTVLAKPADDLVFELVWDHAETDLDLHLLQQGFAPYSNKDCYFGNPRPDFGEFGNLLDDPRLTRDDLNGYGPETIVYSKPPQGAFDVAVIFYSDHGALPTTRATVRVFVYGVLAAEVSRQMDAPGQMWNVLTVDWPGASITPVDTVQQAPAP